MELKLNTKCQLIVDGKPEISNGMHKIELIVLASDPSISLSVMDRTSNFLTYNLPKDGLYFYYEINCPIGDLEDVSHLTTENILNRLEINYLEDAPTHSIDYTKQSVYSICKLRNCLLSLESKSIEDFANVCNKKNCMKYDVDRTKDLLLTAVFVLENLICQQRFSEADRILEALSSCNSLCNTNITNTCGCNE